MRTTRANLVELLPAAWRQWRATRRLSTRGHRFRTTDPEAVVAAYDAMSPAEFDAINAPQDWVNRRAVGRILEHAPKGRPWLALDLGCGTGESTRLVADAAPPGSKVIGTDVSTRLLDFARRRANELDGDGRADIRFANHRLGTPLAGIADGAVRPGAVDVVHSAGVVGHHLDRPALEHLAGDLRELLVDDGIAAIDFGPCLERNTVREVVEAAGFDTVAAHRYVPFGNRGVLVFRRAA